ncbi:phosphoribosylanthranilate isomerase [Tritonibacter mobilis]|uniref:N-(5'-phosphoribosyl)anthranilate isomerase n=1 Tax=Tritonibacter mobilis F1926 TaxID=1265309 RepID=A0A1B1A7Z4_9RHOB|nr:phosphoribosylanthranilate isomerase [Tritonibacter mobilis]ANP42673.1 N-(5'-phosphoribosyl)anthranilate isomerase [Tritonibacter mobilis F1926]KJZ23475.1 N-(5'-phosphoribosyl)anthranilate isomerase [Tritonibacter mobilis]MCA2008182.1 phosphoribosylanthranilate isomerase [Tritonibacter mobilis]NKX73338.1 phosphoribosylanthranilate isomerase [Rhodobacteraceae bacterium R_SAG3]
MAEIRVKICGMKTRADMEAAASAGAAYVGLNFFAKSARSVSIAQAAALASEAPVGLAKVGLVVNPTDADLDAITGSVPLDMIQLHGQESVERVAEIKSRYGLPVMKVIGVAEAADLAPIDLYAQVADQIMIDAKAPKGAKLPGGNGVAFDWQLLAGKKYWQAPWMLAGGLTPENVAEAIRKTGARQVDVASGVETAPAQKDADLMRAFVEAAQAV